MSRLVFALAFLCALAVGCLNSARAEPKHNGQQIYASKCARCHGPEGTGTKKHKKQLAGNLSVLQLADQIRKTMPEDDPETLTDQQARAVATYVHDAFYSAVARARNQPAKIELARLTVRQYRQTAADLIGSFRRPAVWSEQRGLRGEYYRGRRIGRSRVGDRIDAQLDFDFGTAAPLPKIDEPHSFSIRWSGSVLASETGEYEFVVRTEHAARLWINDADHPLIDAWVKSGNDMQYKASMRLTGGRVYPLRLEFTKAKQGVDDSKKRRKKPPSAKASIALLWRRPYGILQPIPSRHLSPSASPEVFVCQTPFPPDDRSFGWQRGTAVSKAWDRATTSAAIEIAGYVTANLNELAGTSDDASDREAKLKVFCRELVQRAFRRPLDEPLEYTFVDRQFKAAANADLAVGRVVLLVLKSPRFLFHEVGDAPQAFNVAARLARGLWDSIPDRELLDAAKAGKLKSKQQLARQAQRMLADRRARTKLHGFLLTWLHADAAADLNKDQQKFSDFDEAATADLRTSLELLLYDVVETDGSDYRQLLLTDDVFLNQRLAKIYGVEANRVSKLDAGFTKVRLDDGKRAGILTHPYIMARFAHRSESSPIHRGVFLARGVLGHSLRPPPEAIAPLAPALHPDLTTRERVTLQTKSTTCMACHAIINPLGFTLEHFDAVGRYRETDRGKLIKDDGVYQTRDGKKVVLRGARELAKFLAESQVCHDAFVEQLFHHLVQQPIGAYGPTTRDDLRRSFQASGFDIRKLAVEIMVASALVGRDTKHAAHPAKVKVDVNSKSSQTKSRRN